MSDRLAEVTARHDAATRGPWRWTGNTTGSGNLFLMAPDKWRHIVMGFERWGMQSAQPTFRVDGIMVKAQELRVCPEDHNPWRVTGLNHPDAVAIERSWEDIDYLLAEVERLHRLETAVRHYHEGHGYIERSQRWQAVRLLLEV